MGLVPALRAETIPVFVFAGQSNALARRANFAELTGKLAVWKKPQRNVLFAGPHGEAIQTGPVWTAIAPVSSATVSFGPDLSAGKAIAAGLKRTIGVVKYAKGGTPLATKPKPNDTWDPNKSGGLYSQMLARVNASLAQLPLQRKGKTGDIAAFFWMQGENDAVLAADAKAYEANLTAFIARVRADLNKPELPFIFGLINVSNTPAHEANSKIVRQAQRNVAAKVAHAHLVDTDSFARVTTDFVHLSTQGTLDLGTAFGNAYLEEER